MIDENSVRCMPELAKAAPLKPSSPSPSNSNKRSRRSEEKRVVQLPLAEAEALRPKGAAEGAPPSDSWTWRKYGQKPIKGSPYPRGYYRCSSSKGCPARKQVERSRTDPTMLVITYSCEHNHPWPLTKNDRHQKNASSSGIYSPTKQTLPAAIEEDDEELEEPSQQEDLLLRTSPPTSSDHDEIFSGLIASHEPSLVMSEELGWFSTDVGSPVSTSSPAETLLYAPVYINRCSSYAQEGERMKDNEEEDSLFAGLGDLPEYSLIFRRGQPGIGSVDGITQR